MSRKTRFDPTKLDHAPGSLTFSAGDVVRKELEAAVDAFVLHENLVAAHLLANAAHEVMRGYAKKHGIDLKVDLLAILRDAAPDNLDNLIKELQFPYNSMKHFQSDIDGDVTFHPDWTQMNLWFAITEHGVLFKQTSPRLGIFHGWSLAYRTGFKLSTVRGRDMFGSARSGTTLTERLVDAKRLLEKARDGGINGRSIDDVIPMPELSTSSNSI